ncbi:nipped-B protein [Condylostylus longicornis]|uniref:nipped-B protein n=1 Tax=Condylostylus longicornis TaxID=2530218 RepID=UPI00244DA88D|nr:nipped-B protein [Condylostylus longicornis]XP_055384071.1 nipped-B protein [Condylostylus longicornis]
MTIMGDRDIPSVPVTTLAGLTSISDLLSELPVSQSFSTVSSLDKSLLFHALVAEESYNLLSVRDDNLVRQLVQAIEQTSAENIELKSQYAISQPQINISEYPELLKGIYTFKPTVFNTPKKHHGLPNTQANFTSNVQHSSGMQLRGTTQTISSQKVQSSIGAIATPTIQSTNTEKIVNQQVIPGTKVILQQQTHQVITSPVEVYSQNRALRSKETKKQCEAKPNFTETNSSASIQEISYNFQSGQAESVISNPVHVIQHNIAAHNQNNMKTTSNSKLNEAFPAQNPKDKEKTTKLSQNQIPGTNVILHTKINSDIAVPVESIQAKVNDSLSDYKNSKVDKSHQQQLPKQLLSNETTVIQHNVSFDNKQQQQNIEKNQSLSVITPSPILQQQIDLHQQSSQITLREKSLQTKQQPQIEQKQQQEQHELQQKQEAIQQQQLLLQQQKLLHQQQQQQQQQKLQLQHEQQQQKQQHQLLQHQQQLQQQQQQQQHQLQPQQQQPQIQQQQQTQMQQPLQKQHPKLQRQQLQHQPQNQLQVQQHGPQTQQLLQQPQNPQQKLTQKPIQQSQQSHQQFQQTPQLTPLQQPSQVTPPKVTELIAPFKATEPNTAVQNKGLPHTNDVSNTSEIPFKNETSECNIKQVSSNQLNSENQNNIQILKEEEPGGNEVKVDPLKIDNEALVNKKIKANGKRKLNCKVRIRKIKKQHTVLILKSIKEYTKKFPSSAKKMNLLLEETKPQDMFSKMKADERRNPIKRKVPSVPNEIPPEEIISKPKLRRVERVIVSTIAKTSKEELQKSQTYQQFMKNIDNIIELLDDTEQPNFNSEETDETIEPIPSKMLSLLSNDVAKLKAKGVLDLIPKNKLTLLINYAMRSIYLARNYSSGPDVEEDMFDEEIMEKVLNAVEATLLICNIYSTVGDLKFLQEDNIASIIKFVQFQFRETIFPSYDPVYIVKNMKKTGGENRKKTKSQHSHNRSLQLFYSKIVELMKVLVTLFDKCIFVDTIILPLSTLAIEPFFVDNIETLQFVCLELVTALFRKEQYVNMRSSILGDILASIDRLPCSKKNLRPFKLANNGGNIQMITALVLQLIQCATILPESLNEKPNKKQKSSVSGNNEEIENGNSRNSTDKDIIVLEKYDTALSIGGNFLTTFLSKCKSRTNETDFRPLFENFIHDLLATVNRPEWPAAELLLSLLGTLLVKYMSDKSIEQAIRLASLDYLGIVAARLRKDIVESRCKVNTMDQMIKSIKAEQEKEGDLDDKDSNIVLDPDEERVIFLQNILLDFLAVNAQEENLIWDYAKNFYLAQWYRDVIQQRKRVTEGDKNYAYRKKKNSSKRNRRKPGDKSGSDEEDSIEEISDDDDLKDSKRKGDGVDVKLNLEIFQALEERKRFLLRKRKPFHSSSGGNTSQYIKTYIDYNNAHLIAQYLASRRPFSQSFDKYLQKIILVVREPAIAIRTRAMKCLANIVEVDPLILKRKDMQMGVNQKFLDTAISVREAAVDLIGKYVLSNEDLIDQYYEMLSKRILDTGVSVRKRVIKILRDICIEYPDFDKIPEICVKMIRRVNDEEGIQKLVTEVFMSMWFTPCPTNDKIAVYRKINQIIDVVNTAHDTGTLWLDGLLTSIFTPKDNVTKAETSADIVKKNTEPPAEVVLACQQLADGLVERLIELEDTDNNRMLGCITTIHLLAKARPKLLVKHAITIEPYLNIKCHSTVAPKFICSVAEILEQVVPLMEHPSDSFLADLEGHLMMLVVSLNQKVVASCVSCLGSVVNKITKNYKLIRDCFSKFYKSISSSRDQLKRNPNLPMDSIYQPIFRRSLYTIGILMRFFDFKSPMVLGTEDGDRITPTICDEVFDSLMFFITGSNLEIRKQALVSLGFFCVQNDDYLTRPELRDFYCDLLTSTSVEPYIKSYCMRNIWMYLTETEINMFNKEKDWAKQSQMDDLKEMNDVSSGMASRIIQLYLNGILKCFIHTDYNVRLWAVKVVQIVLRQGLVHPVIIVPYLIALSTDEKQETSHRSDHLLKELDKTYTGFVNMKVQQGLELSFQLQDVLQSKSEDDVIRGYIKRDNQVVALNDFLYTLLRNTKPQRRALVQTVTKQFDDHKTTLRQMLFLADNLAYFPYMVQDEPLYLIHQIDILISNTGTSLLANFREGLKPVKTAVENTETTEKVLRVDDDDDDEEDKELLFERLPEDTKELQKCIVSAQGCMLLLLLKQHLKDMYGLTDGKISRYSPSEPKIYEKAINRKQVNDFQPKSTIDVIKKGKDIYKELDDKEKRDLIDKYLDFKQLMLRLDPDDADSENEGEVKSKLNTTTDNLGSTETESNENNTSKNDTKSQQSQQKQQQTTQHHQQQNQQQQSQSQQQTHFQQEFLRSIGSTPQNPNVQRSTRTSTKTQNPPKKPPVRSTRKRKKLASSGDDDSDYSDYD